MSKHTSKMLSNKSFEEYIKNSSIQAKNEDKGKLTEIIFPEILPTIKENSAALIKEALIRANNNNKVAAKTLGISPQALYQRMDKKK